MVNALSASLQPVKKKKAESSTVTDRQLQDLKKFSMIMSRVGLKTVSNAARVKSDFLLFPHRSPSFRSDQHVQPSYLYLSRCNLFHERSSPPDADADILARAGPLFSAALFTEADIADFHPPTMFHTTIPLAVNLASDWLGNVVCLLNFAANMEQVVQERFEKCVFPACRPQGD
jgi:hypothetical protein